MTHALLTVPGIGDIWAAIIAAEIGPFERFPNADALEFWAGLTADLKESAGRTQSGNITKAGSVTLRWALCQAAMTCASATPGRRRFASGSCAHRQAQGQRGHGPAAAAHLVRHGPRQKAVSSEDRPRPHRGRQPSAAGKKETSRLTPETTRNH